MYKNRTRQRLWSTRPSSWLLLSSVADQGIYKAKPAAVFSFDEIREAQRLMESGKANGKIAVKVSATETKLASA
jgi:NADPH:quinone reductase-like Zn-dependent oxidoreductase